MCIHHFLTHLHLCLWLLCLVQRDGQYQSHAFAYTKDNQDQSEQSPIARSYIHRKVNIRMSKLPNIEHGTTKPDPVERKPEGNTTRSIHEMMTFNVGGLGLVSSSTGQNRISLGSLSNQMSNVSPKSASERQSSAEVPVATRVDARPPMWPNQNPVQSAKSKVNMRILGQPIDPRVVNHLHPDVTPIKARKLRKILAGTLDKDWTSETAPRVLRQRGVSGSVGGITPANSKLFNEATLLNFTFQHDNGNYFTLGESQLKPFRKWLIDKANCEMDFIWEDLGPLFWPRWIRRGVCINRPGHSCSWPPGMKCRPSGSRALQLLHWKCEDVAQIQSRERAAEQRNRRRTATTNTFHANFYDMQPVDSKTVLDHPPNPTLQTAKAGMLLPRLSLRDTHKSVSMSSQNRPRIRLHGRSINWGVRNASLRRRSELGAALFSKDERRKRRARRLIKRLSVTANGYHCYWQVQKYLISDRCACICP